MELVYSNNSFRHVFHKKDCSFAMKIAEKNICDVKNVVEAHNLGYNWCSHCSPLLEKYKNEMEEIINFCKDFNLYLSVNADLIKVYGYLGIYKIVYNSNDDMLYLYHKNTSFKKKSYVADSILKGYHFQKVTTTTILEGIIAAYDHEIGYLDRPIPKGLKKKLLKRMYGKQKSKKKRKVCV